MDQGLLAAHEVATCIAFQLLRLTDRLDPTEIDSTLMNCMRIVWVNISVPVVVTVLYFWHQQGFHRASM